MTVAQVVSAHFNLNVNIRVIHIEHRRDHLRLLVRLPMAYLVADKLGAEKADGSRDPAPFTTNAMENGTLVHYLDADSLRLNPGGLAKIVADGHVVSADGKVLAAEIGRLRAYPAKKQVPFSSLEEADAALKGPVYQSDFETTYVGDTIIDAEILYRHDAGTPGALTLRSTLDPKLPLQDETANLVLDHRSGEPMIFRIRGLMAEPVEISSSPLAAVVTFITEGIRHILEGADHVLFVFCLLLGATTLRALLWRVTGFTIGHSVTLALGFFGYVPKAAWFVPLVETGIAASIIYAAAIAVSGKERPTAILITALIGLLHGLGFSFVLSEILRIDAPNLWLSLLAFNIGIEIGQLAIALVLWPALFFCAKALPTRISTIRWALAVPCIAIAALWIGDRSVQFVAAL